MPRPRFPARAAGPAERVAGFVAHLRANGLAVGPAETAGALAALGAVRAHDRDDARLALRAVLAGSAEDWRRFDGLFDAYWFDGGRRRQGLLRAARPRTAPRPPAWEAPGAGGGAEGDAPAEGEGRVLGSRREALTRRDLRDLIGEAELREAERIAERIARSIRDRQSRRRRAVAKAPEIDLRRTLRRSVARGGEPLDLARRRRREPPLRIVALLDVSGSMTAYARVLLAFLKGLVGADARTEAYVFHTRLLRITGALAEPERAGAAERLAPMAEGFGGGTRIGHCLAVFNAQHARRALRGRAALLILSDGYDSDPPELLAAGLARLRRRARRIVWMNPLKGRDGYAPVAAGMAAALPHLDAFLPASTLASLAALEAEFAKL